MGSSAQGCRTPEELGVGGAPLLTLHPHLERSSLQHSELSWWEPSSTTDRRTAPAGWAAGRGGARGASRSSG